MVHIGTREIEAAYNNYYKQAVRVLDKFSDQLKKQETQKIKSTIMQVKREILSLFQVICYETFQSVFYDCYGKNYDINSLNKSLMFFIDDNLRPHVSYDIKMFNIKKDFNEDKRKFNQNANIEGSFGRLMDFEALDAIEDMNFYGLSLEEDSPYDWAIDKTSEVEDAKVFKRGKLMVEPKEAYREAQALSMEKFLLEYEKILKPSFKKRYPSLKFI